MTKIILTCWRKGVTNPDQKLSAVLTTPTNLPFSILFHLQLFFYPKSLLTFIIEAIQLKIVFIHEIIPNTGGVHLLVYDKNLYPLS